MNAIPSCFQLAVKCFSLGDQSFFIAVGEGEGEGVRILKRVI